MLCGIRYSHGTNPGKDSRTIPGYCMWFESRGSQPTHYCKMVREMRPYGLLVSANKSRYISRRWKYYITKFECAHTVSYVKVVFWKRYLHKKESPKHANLMMTLVNFRISSIAMHPHERDYVKSLFENVKSLFENPGQALTSKCLKNDKNTQNCDCAL